MKRLSFCLAAVLVITLLVCCNKQSFKDGVGLYSKKQYHCFSIVSPGDTEQLANTVISTSEMNNNYLSWNGITFVLSNNTDSIVTYINDTAINGSTVILYDLNYYPKTDQVVVVGNNVDRIWRSF